MLARPLYLRRLIRQKIMASASAETASSSSEIATAAASPTTERRGIPAAQFVEDVQTFLSQLGLDVNSALAFLQERSLSLSPPLFFFLGKTYF